MPIFMSRERRSWDYWCRNFVSSHEIRGKLSDQRLHFVEGQVIVYKPSMKPLPNDDAATHATPPTSGADQ